jgi:hypothetical protein
LGHRELGRNRDSTVYLGQAPSEKGLDNPNRIIDAQFMAAKTGNTLSPVDHHKAVLLAYGSRRAMLHANPACTACGGIDVRFGDHVVFHELSDRIPCGQVPHHGHGLGRFEVPQGKSRKLVSDQVNLIRVRPAQA